jgi:hypothetical protein
MGYKITVTSYMGCNQAVQIDGATIRGGQTRAGGWGWDRLRPNRVTSESHSL